MKTLVILSILAVGSYFGLASRAFASWEPALSCQGGDLVIDQEWYAERGQWFVRTQMVLRNRAAVEYFLSQGAFGSLADARGTGAFVNERGELIIPGGVDLWLHGDSRYPIASVTTWRFTEEEYRRDGYGFILLNLIDEGYGNYRMSAIKANPYPSARPEIANWLFHDCWRRS